MKIGLQPTLHKGTQNIQAHKNNLAKNNRAKDTVEFSSGPAFTGKRDKLLSLIAAMSASLMLLAGCTQKTNISIMGGTGYKPDTPSHNVTEEKQPSTSAFDPDIDTPPIDKSAQNTPARSSGNLSTPPEPTYEYKGPEYPGGPGEFVQTEESITEQKLYVYCNQLDSITQNIGQINNDLNVAQNELEIKQAEKKKAEEKLKSYERSNPNDKPPGFEADFDKYTVICLDVKRLETLISKLEAEKAEAEAKQNEVISAISDLDGHPHLD